MIATRVAKNEEELSKYNVSVKNDNDELRSTYDILVDLKPEWDKMTSAQRVALGNTLAGTNQYKIFAAIMNQMDTAVSAYGDALESAGTTMEQNSVYMESLEARITLLKAEFDDLVLGKGGLQDSAKMFVSLGTTILKLINNIGGLNTILVTLSSIIITLKADIILTNLTKLQNTITNLIPSLANVITKFKNARAAGKDVSEALKLAGVSATTAQLAFGALTAVITIGVIAWNKYKQKQEEARQSAVEAANAFETYKLTLADTFAKISDESTTKKELIEINKNLNKSYDEEQAKLKEVNELREENIDLLYEEQKAKASETKREIGAQYDKSLDIVSGNNKNILFSPEENAKHSLSVGQRVVDMMMESEFESKGIEYNYKNALEFITKEYDALLKKRDEYLEQGKDLSASEQRYLNALSERYVEYRDKVEDAENVIKSYKEAEEILTKSKDEWLNKIREENAETLNNNQQVELSIEERKRLMEAYGITQDQVDDYIESIEEGTMSESEAILLMVEQKKALVDLSEGYENCTTATTNLVDEISTLASALEEQDENGALALNTQLKLIESGYAAALSYNAETGACQLDTEALKQLVEQKIQNQIQNIKATRQNLIDVLQKEANAAVITAEQFLKLARAKSLANMAAVEWTGEKGGRAITDPSKSTSGWGGNFGYAKSNDAQLSAKNQITALDKQISALEGSLKQIKLQGIKAFSGIAGTAKNAGKSAKNAGSSVKDAADAVEDATETVEDATDSIDEATKALEEQKEALDKEIESLNKLKSDYESVISFINDKISDKINALEEEKNKAVEVAQAEIEAKEKEKDNILDSIEKEINALEKEKDAREKYWEEQISALKKVNEEKKKSIELQEKLDALNKAKKSRVKVYKKGQGFVYDINQQAVDEAQKALDEYLSEVAYEEELQRLEDLKEAELNNFSQRISQLNDYKDSTSNSYQEQIDILEKYLNEIEDKYDTQIENYKNYKKQFEEMVSEYEYSQNELLASQLTGINFENENWMTRLNNLSGFVNEYNNILSKLKTLNAEKESIENQLSYSNDEEDILSRKLTETTTTPASSNSDSGGGYSTSYVPTTTTVQKTTTTKNWVGDKGGSGTSSGNQGYTNKALEAARKRYQKNTKTYASGVGSIQNDEIAIVGENPNKEIVIGSKINNGSLMSLKKGSGIVNSNSTKTLANLFNQIGKYSASNFGSGNGTLNNNTNNDTLIINGVTIQGANIKDAETFVDGLLNLKAEALQRAYKHR